MWTAVAVIIAFLVAYGLWAWAEYALGRANLKRMGLNEQQIEAGLAMINAWRAYEKKVLNTKLPTKRLALIAFRHAAKLRNTEERLVVTNSGYAMSAIMGAMIDERRAAGVEETRTPAPDWNTMIDQVTALYRRGKYGEAETACKEAIALAETSRGPNHSNIAASLGNLAEIYRCQGKLAEAVPLFERSQSIYEKASLPEDLPSLASVMNNRALLSESQGLYELAETLHMQSLKIRLNRFGESHIDVAASYNGLGGLCLVRGKHDDAERFTRHRKGLRHCRQGRRQQDTGHQANATEYEGTLQHDWFS